MFRETSLSSGSRTGDQLIVSYFDDVERRRRLSVIRHRMSELGLDVIVIPGVPHVQGRAYFRYLTDFQLWSTGGYLLLGTDGDPIVTMRRYR